MNELNFELRHFLKKSIEMKFVLFVFMIEMIIYLLSCVDEHMLVILKKFNYICGDGFRWLFISCSVTHLITVKNNIIKDIKLKAHESDDPYVMSILKENLNMLLELYGTFMEVLDKSGLKLLKYDIIRKDLINEKFECDIFINEKKFPENQKKFPKVIPLKDILLLYQVDIKQKLIILIKHLI